MTKAEKTKQHILEMAAPVYNAKGIMGTGIEDVLEAAGVTKGAVYSHFENKEDLSIQTADYLLKKIEYGIGQALVREKTAKGKIFAYMDFNRSPLNTYIDGGCPIFNMAVESDDNHSVIKKKVSTVVSSSLETFTAILQSGIDHREFTKELDPAVFAFKMFSSIEGGIVLCRVMNSALPMKSLITGLKKELESFKEK